MGKDNFKSRKGSATLDKDGTFTFKPYKEGGKPNNMTLLLDEDNISIYESSNYYKISVKVEKTSRPADAYEKCSTLFEEATSSLVDILLIDNV